jgi:hypothetical protein
MLKQNTIDEALATWNGLNEVLKGCSEAACQQLMEAEKEGKNRPTFTRRIHSRLNKVRADRERKELGR